jgi:methionyl-tRNA synthetase
MLHHMSSTEYLNYESGKFSKTRGVGVFGNDVMDTGIPADVWRFYIFYNRPEKADALFTWKDFQEKVNGELIGNLGNLVNRTLSFVTRYYEGQIPGVALKSVPSTPFWDTVKNYETDIAEKLEKADIRDAFHAIFELSSFANKTFQDGAPWKSRVENPAAAEALLRDLCHVVRDIAIMLEPFIPGTAETVAGFFGLTLDRAAADAKKVLSWNDVGKGLDLSEVLKSEILFKKLEEEVIDTLRERYSGSQQDRETAKLNDSNTVDKNAASAPAVAVAATTVAKFEETLDIRVARIVKVERHPNAEKLYIETLEIAGEERVIVSGLVPHYKEEELLNKKILVAYNLKPAKLRGVESRGMLLAAEITKADGSLVVEVLDAGDAPTGTKVSIAGAPGTPVGATPPAEITVDTFFSVPLEVKGYTVLSGGRALLINGAPLRTKIIESGGVH